MRRGSPTLLRTEGIKDYNGEVGLTAAMSSIMNSCTEDHSASFIVNSREKCAYFISGDKLCSIYNMTLFQGIVTR